MEQWKINSDLLKEKILFATIGKKSFKITRNRCSIVLELEADHQEANHQEADTRMLLHAKHARETDDKIVI